MPQQLLWLADVLRAAGLPVREVPGWQQRGHGSFAEILGVLAHHTAGPAQGLYPSESVVVHGRPGLDGPLCNLGLDRAGTWIVVAAGQAWHAGSGSVTWCPANQGNSHMIGVEAESTGVTQPNGDWTPAQRTSYPRGVAALLMHLKLGPQRAIGHKEWAPTRKIDPAFWDMASFRRDVARWMSNPATQEDFLMALTDAEQRRILEAADSSLFGKEGVRFDGTGAGWLRTTRTEVGALRQDVAAILVGHGTVAGPLVLSDADVERIAEHVVDVLSARTAHP